MMINQLMLTIDNDDNDDKSVVVYHWEMLGEQRVITINPWKIKKWQDQWDELSQQ